MDSIPLEKLRRILLFPYQHEFRELTVLNSRHVALFENTRATSILMPDLETVSVDCMRLLVDALNKQNVWELGLGLKDMSIDLALELSRYSGRLRLDSLCTISDTLAVLLRRQHLSLTGLSLITSRQIELLAAFRENEFAPYGHINLSGLDTLTYDQCKALLKFGRHGYSGEPIATGGATIVLLGIDDLDVSLINTMSMFGGSITLKHPSIANSSLQLNAMYYWGHRIKSAHQRLKEAFGDVVSCGSCDFISKIEELTADQFRIISDNCFIYNHPLLHNCGEMHFNELDFKSLRKLTPDVASELAKWRGTGLRFSRLKYVSAETFSLLCEFGGDIEMSALTSLEFLSDVCFADCTPYRLRLNSKCRLSPTQAASIAKVSAYYGVEFGPGVRLGNDGALSALLRSGSQFIFTGIKTLTDSQIALLLNEDKLIIAFPNLDGRTRDRLRKELIESGKEIPLWVGSSR